MIQRLNISANYKVTAIRCKKIPLQKSIELRMPPK